MALDVAKATLASTISANESRGQSLVCLSLDSRRAESDVETPGESECRIAGTGKRRWNSEASFRGRLPIFDLITSVAQATIETSVSTIGVEDRDSAPGGC